MTLLEIVQNIASAIDADEINSITDTTEAYQMALVVKETYYEQFATLDVPTNDSLILLNGLADTTKPNYLQIPSTVKQIKWFKYDYQSLGQVGDYVKVLYLDPEEFIFRTINNAGSSNSPTFVTVTDFSGAKLSILNTFNPTYWTTFDNNYIVTDSYNSAVDTTLQQTKSLCWGENNKDFQLIDTFVPILDEDMFPLLLAEAKSTVFFNQKQTTSPKEEQRARRQRSRIQNDFWKANQRKPYDRIPDYGRRRPSFSPLVSSNTRNPASS